MPALRQRHLIPCVVYCLPAIISQKAAYIVLAATGCETCHPVVPALAGTAASENVFASNYMKFNSCIRRKTVWELDGTAGRQALTDTASYHVNFRPSRAHFIEKGIMK